MGRAAEAVLFLSIPNDQRVTVGGIEGKRLIDHPLIGSREDVRGLGVNVELVDVASSLDRLESLEPIGISELHGARHELCPWQGETEPNRRPQRKPLLGSNQIRSARSTADDEIALAYLPSLKLSSDLLAHAAYRGSGKPNGRSLSAVGHVTAGKNDSHLGNLVMLPSTI